MKDRVAKSINMYALIPPSAGIAVCVILILLFAKNPASTLTSLFTGNFSSVYYFGSMLNTATFLMIAGTGSAISIKSGNMNLGGEGQVYLGGFTGCLLLNTLQTPVSLTWFIAFIAAMLAGAATACLSALLKELRGARVLLTSFLVSSATIPIIDGLITASKSKSGTNMLALPYIQDSFKLPQLLPPSPFNISFFAGLIICALAWYTLFMTYSGRKLQLWGTAPLFARYCGYNSTVASFASLAVSGALHAAAGFFAVTGTYYTCHKDFYVNMGWNALNTALISSSNPLKIIPVALILSWLFTSASRVSLTQGFDFDIAGIVQGVILFSIAIAFASAKRTKK